MPATPTFDFFLDFDHPAGLPFAGLADATAAAELECIQRANLPNRIYFCRRPPAIGNPLATLALPDDAEITVAARPREDADSTHPYLFLATGYARVVDAGDGGATHYDAPLSIAGDGLTAAFLASGGEPIPARVEITVTSATVGERAPYQFDALIRRGLYTGGAPAPPAEPPYPPASTVATLAYVAARLGAAVDLSLAHTADLDALVTATLPRPAVTGAPLAARQFYNLDALTLQTWLAFLGTDATGATKRRAGDYADPANPVVWVLF